MSFSLDRPPTGAPWGVITSLLWRDNLRLCGSGARCLEGVTASRWRVFAAARIPGCRRATPDEVIMTRTGIDVALLEPLWNLLRGPYEEVIRRREKNVMILVI